MDYHFFSPQQVQQPVYSFIGLPPTPANTNTTSSEEFGASPPSDIAYDQFQNFVAYQQFNAIPKPLTPPSIQYKKLDGGLDNEIHANDEKSRQIRGGSNSEDEDLTPAQSRRKAQNRAAQRAFRERKERHVKDLEAKLADMEKSSAGVAAENERLKRDLQKVAIENEILRATSSMPKEVGTQEAGPMRFSPTDFYTEVLHGHENKTPSHRIVTSEEGEKLFAAGATWDYIIGHPLYQQGLVDVGDVSERLKGAARCDGQGPVFQEKDIVGAIERSVTSGNDSLL